MQQAGYVYADHILNICTLLITFHVYGVKFEVLN